MPALEYSETFSEMVACQIKLADMLSVLATPPRSTLGQNFTDLEMTSS